MPFGLQLFSRAWNTPVGKTWSIPTGYPGYPLRQVTAFITSKWLLKEGVVCPHRTSKYPDTQSINFRTTRRILHITLVNVSHLGWRADKRVRKCTAIVPSLPNHMTHRFGSKVLVIVCCPFDRVLIRTGPYPQPSINDRLGDGSRSRVDIARYRWEIGRDIGVLSVA